MEQPEILRRNRVKKQQDKFISYHLNLETSLGCNQSPMKTNSFIVSSSILYLNDGCLVMHNILQGTKRFLLRIQPKQTVVAMACNQAIQFVISLAIITQTSSYFILFDSRTSSTLKHYLPKDQTIVDIHFYSSNEIVVLSKTDQENFIFIKRFYRNDNLSFSQTKQPPARKSDNNNIKIIGQHHGIVYLLQNDSVVSACYDDSGMDIQKFSIIDLVDAIIYSNDQVICLTKTSVVLYQKRKWVQQIIFSDIFDKQVQGFCLLKLTKRFIIGHKNSVSLSVFSFDGLRMKHIETYKYKQRLRGGVFSLHGSFEQMNIGMTIFVSNRAQMPQIQNKKILPKDIFLENMVFSLTSINTERISSPFNRIFKNQIEYDTILSMQNSMVPECYFLTQKSLTVYNYSSAFKAFDKFYFAELPLGFCIHPMAHQLVCFFKDCIRIYYRMQSQLSQIKKQMKICSTGRFSSKGLLALAVQKKNHYDIELYDISKLQSYKTLTCLSSKTPITKINWSRQDTQIEVYCQNQVFIINIAHDNKIIEFSQTRSLKFLQYDYMTRLLLGCTLDGSTLKVYGVQQGSNQLSQCLVEVEFSNQQIRSIYIDKITGIVIIGMYSGVIKWCQWPWLNLAEKDIHKSFLQIQVSSSPISKIFMTLNSKFTIAISQNNTISVIRNKKKKNGKMLNYQIDIQFSTFHNIKLFQTNVIANIKDKIKSLQQKQISYNNELQQFRTIWQAKQISQLTSIDQQNKQIQRQQNYLLMKQIQENRKKKNQISRNFTLLTEGNVYTEGRVKQQQQRQMIKLYDQIDKLKVYKQSLAKRMEEEYIMAEKFYEQTLNDIKEDFEDKVKNMKDRFVSFSKKLQQRKEVKKALQQNILQQNQQMKRVHEVLMKKSQIQLKTVIIEMQGKISKLKRQSERFQSRKQFLENKKKRLALQLQFQQQQTKQLKLIQSGLESQMKRVQKTTYGYEETINQLSSRNNHLINFRNVYLNLQNTLSQQIKTLQQYSSSLSFNIKKMNSQLVDVIHKTQSLESQQNQIKSEIFKQKQLLSRHERPRIVINSFCNDIYHQLHLENPDDHTPIKKIYKKFFGNLEYINSLARLSLTSKMVDNNQITLKNKQEEKFKKIRQNLVQKKQYYKNSIQLFNYQHKSLDQSLSGAYNKLQTHNSKLIAQCNGLKQQINKKSRTLNELFSTLRTIDCMSMEALRNPYFTYEFEQSKTKRDKDLMQWFPQVEQGGVRRSMVKTSQSHTRNKKKKGFQYRQSQQTEDSFTGRRLLSVRRIMTANQNNRDRYQLKQLKDMQQIQSTVPSKPATNHGQRRSSNQWRSKSKRTGDKDKSSVFGFSVFEEKSKNQ